MSLLGFRRSYRFFSLFRLGADECVDNASDPQQHFEQQQPGKQFDHVNPSIFKFNILFTLYVCIAYFVAGYAQCAAEEHSRYRPTRRHLIEKANKSR